MPRGPFPSASCFWGPCRCSMCQPALPCRATRAASRGRSTSHAPGRLPSSRCGSKDGASLRVPAGRARLHSPLPAGLGQAGSDTGQPQSELCTLPTDPGPRAQCRPEGPRTQHRAAAPRLWPPLTGRSSLAVTMATASGPNPDRPQLEVAHDVILATGGRQVWGAPGPCWTPFVSPGASWAPSLPGSCLSTLL